MNLSRCHARAHLLAVLAYGEDFARPHAVAFGCIWLALALYSADAWTRRRPRNGGDL